jgi:hypothetical protein
MCTTRLSLLCCQLSHSTSAVEGVDLHKTTPLSFETLIHAQQLQNLAHQTITAAMKEMISNPTVPAHNVETPISNKEFVPTATPQPPNLPYSK